MEENLAKNSPLKQLNEGKKRLFKKYEKDSKAYLQENLFRNPCIIKLQDCKYSTIDSLVTIYYDEFTDLFAIVNSNNYLIDLGIATKLNYAEIFAFKSSGVLKKEEFCSKAKISVEDSNIQGKKDSKQVQVYQEQTILSREEALAILDTIYNSNFITVENGEFKIEEWQAAKKLSMLFALD